MAARSKQKAIIPIRDAASTAIATSTTIRGWLVQLINDNRQQIEQDFKSIEPEKRLAMLEKLLPYLMPKVVSPDAVEGACYSRTDVHKADNWLDKDRVLNWYEQQ